MMLSTVTIDPRDRSDSAATILDAWARCKVLHIRVPGLAPDEVRDFYEQLLPRIGTPSLYAEDVRVGDRNAQRTGGLWTEVRYDPGFTNAYRHSANAQPLHTDGSYGPSYPNATLMCCVRNAGEGGETIFVSASDVEAALEQEAPDLLKQLKTVPIPHERSGDRRVLPFIRRVGDEARVNWNYYCVAANAPAEALALREPLFAWLRDSPAVARAIVPVKLATGDAVTWKDDTVLHGRNAFRANVSSERFLWKCAVDVGVFAEVAAPAQ
jgi:alpha-ketoglutarate-dependent taurine dioxygenase